MAETADRGRTRHRLRRRLQSRPMAGGRLGRRHPPDDPGRCQHRGPCHLQLGPPPTHRDHWDFGWLDRIIDKLGKAGIAVDLASATATAPLWLYENHPEVLPRDKYGHPVNAGSRQSWSPTSPVFKEYALTLCRKLAERYGANPYVTAWHMGNEYGWNNRDDYSDNALEAFRAWCRRQVRHHRRT